MNRFEKIRAKRQSLDAQEMAREQKAANEVAAYTARIKALAPRIDELTQIAGELLRNDLPLGRPRADWWYEKGELETDGISHRLGFVMHCENGKRMFCYEIGIEGGGCDGNDIVVDRCGNITKNPLDKVIGLWTSERAHWDFCNKCERLLSAFDAFEEKVFDYVDNM